MNLEAIAFLIVGGALGYYVARHYLLTNGGAF